MAIEVSNKIQVHNEEPKSPIKIQSCAPTGRGNGYITLIVGSEELIVCADDVRAAIDNCTNTNAR